MVTGIIGKKVGMTQLFAPDGTEVGNGTSISHTAGVTGLYRIRVSAVSGQGTYVLQTAGATATQVFQVTASEPVAGYADATFPATYTVHFSEAVLRPSIEAGDLVVTQPGGGALTIEPTMAEVTATVAVTAAAVAMGW